MKNKTHRLAQVMICAVVLLFAAAANAALDADGRSTTASTAAVPQYHDSVVIVLDNSGSMGEAFGGARRIDAAKQGLKVVLRKVPQSTWIALLAFDGWQYELAPRDDAQVNAAINRIEPGNMGTPLARHIRIGADRLLQEREKQFGYGTYRLLVVTDGEETEDKHAIERVPPEVVARGLALDVIGVGIGEDHSLRKHAHRYRGADDPAALDSALSEVLAEVDSAATTNDVAGADAFDLLDGLEPEVAQAMIDALTRTGNHPIGTQPPPDPNAQQAGRQGMRHTPDPQGSPGGVGSNARLPPGCEGCQAGGGNSNMGYNLLVGLFIGFFLGRFLGALLDRAAVAFDLLKRR